jgi:hypothetical protein
LDLVLIRLSAGGSLRVEVEVELGDDRFHIA